jgi:hypothetical protein
MVGMGEKDAYVGNEAWQSKRHMNAGQVRSGIANLQHVCNGGVRADESGRVWLACACVPRTLVPLGVVPLNKANLSAQATM